MKAEVVVVVGTSGAKQFQGSSEVTPRKKKFAVGTFKHTHRLGLKVDKLGLELPKKEGD